MEALSKSRMAISATAVLTIALLATPAYTTKTSASSPQPLPEVKVATVEQRDVRMYREWIGTLDGLVNAAIKAQVTGYLLSQDYTEGSFVRRGHCCLRSIPDHFKPLSTSLRDSSQWQEDSLLRPRRS